MAQYHKIPQNVTAYEGRIVGKFTAKQFIFLAIGAITVFLIWNTNISRAPKLIFSIIFGGTSLLFAIANYDGRSTDTWLANFIQVVYQPTQRSWLKSGTPPAYLMPGYHPPKHKRAPRKRTSAELNELISIWHGSEPTSELTNSEKTTLKRLRKIRKQYAVNTPPLAKSPSRKPSQ